MIRLLLPIFLLISNLCYTQVNETFIGDLLFEEELMPQDKLEIYTKYAFSKIWTQTKNQNVVGIIGEDHQRIRIKIISVKKNPDKPKEYNVTGKSMVKGTICSFIGTITLTRLQEFKQRHYGVDNEYEDKGIKTQGILIANYKFEENTEEYHSGYFTGQLYSKWYLNAEDQIEYDNIQGMSDGYMNNAYIGTWTSYTSGKEKICNWGDFRVPKANEDFDNGAGEFSPSKKYITKGWESYQQAWVRGDEVARKEELREWWK